MSLSSNNELNEWCWNEQPAKNIYEIFLKNKFHLVCPHAKCNVKRLFEKNFSGNGTEIKPQFSCSYCKTKYDIIDFYINIIKGKLRDLPEKTYYHKKIEQKSPTLSIKSVKNKSDVVVKIEKFVDSDEELSDIEILNDDSEIIYNFSEKDLSLTEDSSKKNSSYISYSSIGNKTLRINPGDSYSIVNMSASSSKKSNPVVITSTKRSAESENSSSKKLKEFKNSKETDSETFLTYEEFEKKINCLKDEFDSILMNQNDNIRSNFNKNIEIINVLSNRLEEISNIVDESISEYSKSGVAKINQLTKDMDELENFNDSLTNQVIVLTNVLEKIIFIDNKYNEIFKNFDINHHLQFIKTNILNGDAYSDSLMAEAKSKPMISIPDSSEATKDISTRFHVDMNDYDDFILKMSMVGVNFNQKTNACDISYKLRRIFIKGIVKTPKEKLIENLKIFGFNFDYILNVEMVSKKVYEFTVYFSYAPKFCSIVNDNDFITILPKFDPLDPDFPNPIPEMKKYKISSYIYKLRHNIENSKSEVYKNYANELISEIEQKTAYLFIN
ncbi:hypothetical protein AYI68_g7687 [Smittium mucronatum]|uniref:Uncharacterized protein n=1 Tax=Smittium mucronatum TaxID=133383 RepID=A0A1R0GN25_9FUNG|nr:hypothetical protein AYI68_g7687 [Smittium mucronatum]